MSNHLAFATVTATLCNLLTGAIPGNISEAIVTSRRPDAVDKNAVRINAFLYQVTSNPAWRNADLPTRRADGKTAQRPQAAFDLHYLISFHGTDTDESTPQQLLGAVVRVLHSQPVLSRKRVADVSTGSLPDSDLAEQVEMVRFTPLSLSLEELSKLWSVFFQVPYRLSIAYQASVVLIDAEVTPEPALPVQARNLYVVPFRQPEIDEVIAEAGRGKPILSGSKIVLRGRNLRGDHTMARIGRAKIKPDEVSDSEVRLTLPAVLPAGVLGVQIVHPVRMGTPEKLHAGTESNVAPFVLRPAITKMNGEDHDFQISAGPVTVSIKPPVRKKQRAVLLLNLINPRAFPGDPTSFSFVATPRPDGADEDGDKQWGQEDQWDDAVAPSGPGSGDTTIEFEVQGLNSGRTFLARVQVDGAESLLDTDMAGPKVTVP